MKRRIALISTGGTIEKTYDELSGVLANHVSVLDVMLVSLELRGVEVQRVSLMNKDSLDMTPEDHTLIAEIAGRMARECAGVVVVHGTDRLAVSGDRVVELVGTPASPIVFTGAMRPYELRSPDALQMPAAIRCGCQAFITNDQALTRVQELRVLLVEEMSI